MIEFLARIFIPDRKNIASAKVRTAYGSLCGVVGIVLNILLFAFKLLVGTISGAISVTADALNNLTDAGSSVITLIGFRMSEQKPDKDHPFGHGRIEYLSGLIVSVIIILVGFELGKSSVEKIMAPTEISVSAVSVIILGASVLVKAYMAFYNFKVGKRISSVSMKATATDSLTDCIATFAVLCGLLISRFFSVNVDAYLGLAVAAFILFSGIRAVKETVDPLLGTAPEKELIDEIYSIVLSHKEVVGIHDLIVHDYGPGRRMISLHAEVSADADMLETHDMIDNVEKELGEKLKCDAVIHMDPIVTDDTETSEMRNRIAELMLAVDGEATVHDFRMVKGPTHTNLIFDVAVPADCKKSEAEVLQQAQSLVKTLDNSFNAVVNVDRNYL